MKIFNGKFGFSTSAFSKNLSDNTENKYYINVQFKKGTEPTDVLEGNLFFRDKDGNERPCFLSSYRKNDGSLAPKLIIMGGEQTHIENNDTHNSAFGNPTPTVNDEQLDLPFYGG